MEIQEGSTAHTLAILAMDRAEALDRATVELQAAVGRQLAESQTLLRKEAGELQGIARKQAAELQALRQEVRASIEELKQLQPGIERSAGLGVQKALAAGMGAFERDLSGQVSSSTRLIQESAEQARGMIRRLNAQWAALIGGGGLLLGMLLMYLFAIAWERRIEEKIDRLQQGVSVAAQPAQIVAPPQVQTNKPGGRPKGRGSRPAAPESKPAEPEVMPTPVPDQP